MSAENLQINLRRDGHFSAFTFQTRGLIVFFVQQLNISIAQAYAYVFFTPNCSILAWRIIQCKSSFNKNLDTLWHNMIVPPDDADWRMQRKEGK